MTMGYGYRDSKLEFFKVRLFFIGGQFKTPLKCQMPEYKDKKKKLFQSLSFLFFYISFMRKFYSVPIK